MGGEALRETEIYPTTEVLEPVADQGQLGMRRAKLRVLATVAADVIGLSAASIAAALASEAYLGAGFARGLPEAVRSGFPGGLLGLMALVPYWIAIFWAFGLYRVPGRNIGGASLSVSLQGPVALASASWLLLIALVVASDSVPMIDLFLFWLFSLAAVPLVRWVGRRWIWSSTLREKVLIIGAGEVGHMLVRKILNHPEYQMSLYGFLDDGEPRGNRASGPLLPMVGSFSDLSRIIREQQIDRVIVAFSRARHDDFLTVVRTCADTAVRVNIVPRLFEVVSSRALVDDIEGIPLLDVGHVELSRTSMIIKRVFDLLVGGICFAIFLPVLAVVALIIKLDSRGPVFYRQERMGRGGKSFWIYKFRSMYHGADAERKMLEAQNEYSGPMFKMREDPRITKIGGVIRRWSIDELPQIINVMLGEMSLVGPRPLWVDEARQIRGWSQKRLDITPGITGLWQVLGRSDIPFDEMVKLDYMYVTGWSLGWDIKLILQTIPAVLGKRGAY